MIKLNPYYFLIFVASLLLCGNTNASNNIFKECDCNPNVDLYKSLKDMYNDDQQYRSKMYKYPGLNNDSFWNLQENLDSLNQIQLISIFKKYEFCCIYETYPVAVQALLSHTKDSIRINFYLPILLKSINEGHGNPHVYANLIDQMKVFSGQKQIYGMIICNQGKELCQIEDLANLNKRRKEIGLESIEEYCKANNIELPK